MLFTVLFAIGFIAVAFIFLAIKILLKKGGKFPNTHIGGNKKLTEKGISCALSTDARDRARKNLATRMNEQN